jgi:hypothetical protein
MVGALLGDRARRICAATEAQALGRGGVGLAAQWRRKGTRRTVDSHEVKDDTLGQMIASVCTTRPPTLAGRASPSIMTPQPWRWHPSAIGGSGWDAARV